MTYNLTLKKDEFEFIKGLNRELEERLSDNSKFREYENVSYVRVDWRNYPVLQKWVELYLSKDDIEKILYYLPDEHYLKWLFQGYVDFQVMNNNW